MHRLLSVLLTLAILLQTSGCSLIIHGTTQTVTVVTSPAGQAVHVDGREVRDGERITVNKRFAPPRFNLGEPRRPVLVEMQYDPDALLIVDAALLLLGIVPGVIAIGIDLGTGAWRQLHPTQHVYVGGDPSPEPEPTSAPPE